MGKLLSIVKDVKTKSTQQKQLFYGNNCLKILNQINFITKNQIFTLNLISSKNQKIGDPQNSGVFLFHLFTNRQKRLKL